MYSCNSSFRTHWKLFSTQTVYNWQLWSSDFYQFPRPRQSSRWQLYQTGHWCHCVVSRLRNCTVYALLFLFVLWLQIIDLHLNFNSTICNNNTHINTTFTYIDIWIKSKQYPGIDSNISHRVSTTMCYYTRSWNTMQRRHQLTSQATKTINKRQGNCTRTSCLTHLGVQCTQPRLRWVVDQSNRANLLWLLV